MRSHIVAKPGGRAVAVAAVLLFFAIAASAQLRPAKPTDAVTTRPNGVRVALEHGILEVALAGPDVVRIRVAPDAAALDAPSRSYAVTAGQPAPPSAQVFDSETGGNRVLTVVGPEVQASVSISRQESVRVTIKDAAGRVVLEDDPTDPLALDPKTGETRVAKARARDEVFYGFGEKSVGLERSSQFFTNWNYDTFGYPRGLDPIYQSIPFYVSLRQGLAYGLFFDNTYRSWFDVAKTHRDRVAFGAAGGWADYYVFAGGRDRDPRKVIERYTELTGRMPMQPLWSLGYQQSRWSYYPEERVRKLANDFRRNRIPCDVLYLDIDYMDGYRVFTWDRSRFPDPKKFLADLRADGFRVVVIIDPGIKVDEKYDAYVTGRQGGHFVKAADGSEFHGVVWPGVCAFPDFTDPSARRWWGDQFRGLIEDGIAGFWNDMNEPGIFVPDDFQEPRLMHHPLKTFPLDTRHAGDGAPGDHARYHNVYGMQMTRATREGVERLAPERRPFLLTRASFAGGQRYSASWTGDNVASWDHLRLSIPMLVNMGLSGEPMVGTDIGGFADAPTPELYGRWLQAAALTPLMRSHTQSGTPEQDPMAYGPEWLEINRRAIELRYQFMPYLYMLLEESSRTGLPMMRPMWLDFREDVRTYLIEDQFMVGRDLLVAPVVAEGATSRKVYFPAGTAWCDWYTGERHEGGREVEVKAPLDRLPLFVRAGAIIPTRPVAQHTDAQAGLPITLRVFPGGPGELSLYEDAGDGYGYQRGERALTIIRQAIDGSGRRTLRFLAREGSFRPAAATIGIEVIGQGAPERREVPNDGTSRTVALN